ncbi:hypothetical protein HWV62_20238 [Athelia sp. TMB]|nr:hypothetical protein HWV62_20238 [Athelia sp. TMB]
MFLGPRITDLTILLPLSPTIADQSLLISLSAMMQDITHFSVRRKARRAKISEEDPARTNHILKDVISSWNRLAILEIPDTLLTAPSLTHIAQLPGLRAIYARLSPDIKFSSLKLPTVFPALRRLGLTCNSVLTVQALLMISPLWVLQYLKVKVSSPGDDAQTIKSFFTFLQTQLSNPDLRSMIVCHSEGSGAYSSRPLNLSTIAPLFSFPNIGLLRISPHTFDMNNDDLRTIAQNWPDLISLHLGGYGWGLPSKITLSGLVPLLNTCSKLLYLSLAIDATIVDTSLDEITFTRSNIHLKALCLQDSRLEDPQMAAAFLSGIMTNATSFSAWDVSGSRGLEHVSQAEAMLFERLWKETELALKLFTQVRKQERLLTKIS